MALVWCKSLTDLVWCESGQGVVLITHPPTRNTNSQINRASPRWAIITMINTIDNIFIVNNIIFIKTMVIIVVIMLIILALTRKTGRADRQAWPHMGLLSSRWWPHMEVGSMVVSSNGVDPHRFAR